MNAQQIRRAGFDKSSKDGNYVHVGCSQCASVVVNNVPIHERGCPNDRSSRRGGRRFSVGLGCFVGEEEE